MNDRSKRNILFNLVQSVLDRCSPVIAAEFRNYHNLAEKQIQERDKNLDTQVSIAKANAKVTADHHMMLRQIQDAVLLAMQSNYDRDQLQLVITQIYIKIMDYGIHPHEAAIPQRERVE